MSLFDELASCLAMLREANIRLEAKLYDEELSEVEAQQAWSQPRFRVGDAARLTGMHPQTLRQYDRLGLVVPGRTGGGGRRYSLRDLAHLHEVQTLSQEAGVNLEGIRRIMELQRRVDELEAENAQLSLAAGASNRVFAANSTGEVTSLTRGERPEKTRSVGFPVSRSSALVLWRR
ncbi:MAG: MerR family transcriptional regulator [Mobiluncus porci]|uniref:MerR family transcriptional regulator n=1 Tax=Mobiluncus porci TaxID=2652278 RepID=A0A7K0K2G4_9ACTO|nr:MULTISPECIES: MerR family transcriptional regulator [Mobiluncus]MCI6585485.1 MerR family transcriptional regulator [Mobiluncus sp.]MDD7541306.1 MerR family transcriptional regulator [Mobiluncus porci]MDY5747789.1 MerR family transcriptional regulator [Mobiluncus porci]MST49671.1 MerR family transcriptional regulator [Mobiluncus porci]